MPEGDSGVPLSAEEVLTEGTKIVVDAGYDYSETGAGLIYQLSEEAVERLSEKASSGKLPLKACNSFIPGTFSITDKSCFKALEEYVDTVLRRSAKIGIETMVFGSGAARRIPDGMDRLTGRERIDDFLKMCSEYAEKYGIVIAIEPLNRRECNILNTVAEGAETAYRLNLSKIKLLADSFHMYCESEDLSILKDTAKILTHIHIAEPPERVYPGKSGGQYLTEFAKVLKESGYSGRVSIECGYSDFKADISAAKKFISEVF